MEILEKRWEIAAQITPEAVDNLKEFTPTMQQLLFNRGVSTEDSAAEFLNAELPAIDVYILKDMEAAVSRIAEALEKNEAIVVYGDYDSDGVTASAVMAQTLTALGADVSVYIPDRFSEGYGLNNAALSKLKSEGAALVITVDCGIRALPEALHAQKIGLDLIITDHHTPGEEIPDALAVINPKRADDEYPEKNLAGAGVAYKLASALISKFQPEDLRHEHLLDLVAIGTVADLVPLIGENRALVKQGLRYLRRPHRQGLQSLMGIAGVKPPRVAASHIGFSIGPRINAAGRLGSAMDAYNLLMEPDVFEAGKLAQELDNINRERQSITAEIQEKAAVMAEENDEGTFLIFAADESFNMGIVGLAASRLVDTYYRPSVVAHHGEEFTRGSCRSISEFHITHALDQCGDLLEHWGGHAAAAGFTVKNENTDEFVARMKKIAEKELSGKELRPVIHGDMEVNLSDLDMDLLEDLDKLQPTGYGNREAVFVVRNVTVKNSRTVGKDHNHLKLTVTDGFIYMDAIAFQLGHWYGSLPDQIDVLFNFEMNEFQGRKSLQLNVRDIKESN